MSEQNELGINSPDDDITLDSLQKIINTLHEELHAKDILLENALKDRERLKFEVKKYKRSNINLKQQLEDERTFYLKEKEYYCKEMSVTKKKRQEQKEELKGIEEAMQQVKVNDTLKKEISKLKTVLNETLEANYNLSVKFLRMKNTKYSLKTRLKREQTENAKIISDLSIKLDNTKEEITHIISDKFRMAIPPSNKKYLQVVKQNTQLIHDNLTFQVKISKLCNDIERVKAEKIKNETSLRLQYARKLKIDSKDSCDKICQANLCNMEQIEESHEKPSDTTISSISKDYPIFRETQYSTFQKNAIRTQSAPEFQTNEDNNENEDGNNIQYQNT